MSAHQDLLNAYAHWRQLSEVEGSAIEDQCWNVVADCQKSKAVLQSRIVQATERAQQECTRSGIDWKEMLPGLRTIMNDLIQLETRNSRLLDQVRKAAAAEKAELDLTSQNLRRVQKSYGIHDRAAWHSYS